jgi:hypothetical protein
LHWTISGSNELDSQRITCLPSAPIRKDFDVQPTITVGFKVTVLKADSATISYLSKLHPINPQLNCAMDNYRYTPLQPGEIRLVELFPGQFDDPIVVELSHESLLRYGSPKYEALSYAWGGRENPRFIRIQDHQREIKSETRIDMNIGKLEKLDLRSGQEATYSLAVTQNLEAALQHLRRIDVSRILWIDAICIDQGNAVERSAEVHRMGDIYNWAVRVIIWLGKNHTHTRSAVEILRQIGEDVEWDFDKRRPFLRNKNNVQMLKQLRECYACSYTACEKAGIQDLLSRPWFSRLWIWQELCRARTAVVVCGDYEVNWNTLSISILCIHRQVRKAHIEHPDQWKDFEQYTWQILGLIEEARSINSSGVANFYRLLKETEYTSCEDPRDRIYAQISMLPKPLRDKIIPDYRKDASQVYANAFRQVSLFNGYLKLLSQCGERPSDKCLPSWVPNWAAPRDTPQLGISIFIASGNSESEIYFEDDVMLLARGVRSATVAEVSDQVTLGSQFEDVLSVWKTWAQPNSGQRRYSKSETLLDAYCYTICSGKIKERCPDKSYTKLKIARPILGLSNDQDSTDNQKRAQNRYAEYCEHDRNTSKQLQKYERNAVNCCGGRRFFTTVEGYIGLGPAEIQPGDAICILLGLDYPIALRPVYNGQYLVIGCCYVHGLMDGEGILGSLPGSWRVEYWRPNLAVVEKSIVVPFFVNTETGERTQEDPRLWQLPPGWSSYLNGAGVLRFRDEGGMKIWADPRLTSEELKKHGIKTQTFRII